MGVNMSRNHKKKETEAVAVTFRRYTQILLDGAVTVYMLLILSVMPFYNQEGFTHIGTDKSAFFHKVSTTMGKAGIFLLFLYLIFILAEYKERKKPSFRWKAFFKEHFTVTDIFAGAYGISLLLSYSFSRYKSNALWGASGWYMGLYTQLTLLGIYFFVSKFWKPKKWVFYVILPVSAVVFLLGYLNRFQIYPLKMGDYGPLFISTIGNINWYCGYQVSVFFAGLVLLWQGISYKAWQRYLLMFYVLLGFASLVTQGSNSGIMALAVVVPVMFCLSVSGSGRMYRFWQEMVLLSLACLMTYGIQAVFGRTIDFEDIFLNILTAKEVAVFMTVISFSLLIVAAVGRKRKSHLDKVWRTLARVCVGLLIFLIVIFTIMLAANTLYPGSIGELSGNSLFTFSNTWGSNRGATWKAGVLCFWEQDVLHKLVGVGPDAMEAYIYHGGSPHLQEIVTSTFLTARLTNAHNEWLTMLVNTGILGFASYVGMMISGMIRMINQKGRNIIVCACGFCLLGYTANNMFSFQQSMNVATVFVIFGMGEAFLSSKREK